MIKPHSLIPSPSSAAIVACSMSSVEKLLEATDTGNDDSEEWE